MALRVNNRPSAVGLDACPHSAGASGEARAPVLPGDTPGDGWCGDAARQGELMETLARIDRAVLACLDADDMDDVLLASIHQALGGSRCAVIARLEGDGVLQVRGLARGGHRRDVTLGDGALRLRSLANTTGALSVVAGEPEAELFSFGGTAPHWLVFPLRVGGTLIAAMGVGHEFPGAVDAEEMPLAMQLADRVAVALSNVAYERELYRQARRDDLTGLPNRALLQDRVEQALARARREENVVAVLFMDLDRFKSINDSLGHGAGDALLVEVAQRLRGAVRDVDTVVRWGGDEFVVLLPDMPRDGLVLSRASRVAESMQSALAAPVDLAGTLVQTGASIGIAVFPHDADNPEGLLRAADTALYQAKSLGRGGYQFYSTQFNREARDRIGLAEDLKRALNEDELYLEYQPCVSLADGRVVAAECLLRWQHPRHGVIGPATLLPVAGNAGLMEEVGRWVARTACAQLRLWTDRGLEPVRLAINISPREFEARALVGTIREALADSGVAPWKLEMELTEAMLVRQVSRSLGVMRDLHDLGVSLVLDDFGTGFSSVAHLARFPIQGIKVDRSFVRDAGRRPEADAVIAGATGLAAGLGLRVVAEGVETPAQARRLRELGCHEAQGHYFGVPEGADRLTAGLARVSAPALRAVPQLAPHPPACPEKEQFDGSR